MDGADNGWKELIRRTSDDVKTVSKQVDDLQKSFSTNNGEVKSQLAKLGDQVMHLVTRDECFLRHVGLKDNITLELSKKENIGTKPKSFVSNIFNEWKTYVLIGMAITAFTIGVVTGHFDWPFK